MLLPLIRQPNMHPAIQYILNRRQRATQSHHRALPASSYHLMASAACPPRAPNGASWAPLAPAPRTAALQLRTAPHSAQRTAHFACALLVLRTARRAVCKASSVFLVLCLCLFVGPGVCVYLRLCVSLCVCVFVSVFAHVFCVLSICLRLFGVLAPTCASLVACVLV